MIKKAVLFVSITLFIFTSCNSSAKKEEKDIQERLSAIERLIQDNALNAAKIELDSIHVLYPKKVDARRTAKALEDTITRRETMRTLIYCDSVLPVRLHQADSLQKNFRFEKNETYQEVGNYVYKTLQIEANIDRIYMRAYVDENADFYLISNYTGKYPLEHTNVRVSMDDSYANTDTIPAENPFNHSFREDDAYWEVVTFKNDAAGNVPAFINLYTNQRLKVTLSGKRTYNYYLTDMEKKALSETYSLWVVRKDVLQLQTEIKKARAIIERINQRHEDKDMEEDIVLMEGLNTILQK